MGRFEAYSAGVAPTSVHPLAVEVMQEMGIDISRQEAKSVTKYLGTGHFGYIITLCQESEDRCPTAFPDISIRLHWPMEDPTESVAPEEQRVRFRRVRDQLIERIKTWISETGVD